MNKRTLVLEAAKQRLAQAEKNIEDDINNTDMVNMLAQRMEENGVYIFIEPLEHLLVISSLRTHHTIH